MWAAVGIFVAGAMVGGSIGAVVMAVIAAGSWSERQLHALGPDRELESRAEDV